MHVLTHGSLALLNRSLQVSIMLEYTILLLPIAIIEQKIGP